jgi:hypothetical protein
MSNLGKQGTPMIFRQGNIKTVISAMQQFPASEVRFDITVTINDLEYVRKMQKSLSNVLNSKHTNLDHKNSLDLEFKLDKSATGAKRGKAVFEARGVAYNRSNSSFTSADKTVQAISNEVADLFQKEVPLILNKGADIDIDIIDARDSGGITMAKKYMVSAVASVISNGVSLNKNASRVFANLEVDGVEFAGSAFTIPDDESGFTASYSFVAETEIADHVLENKAMIALREHMGSYDIILDEIVIDASIAPDLGDVSDLVADPTASNVEAVDRGAVSPDDVRELDLFIDNDQSQYKRKVEMYKNLTRKIKREVYDRERAPKLFMYLVNDAAKAYDAMYGSGDGKSFSKATKEALAEEMVDEFEAVYKNKEYDFMSSQTASNLDIEAAPEKKQEAPPNPYEIRKEDTSDDLDATARDAFNAISDGLDSLAIFIQKARRAKEDQALRFTPENIEDLINKAKATQNALDAAYDRAEELIIGIDGGKLASIETPNE